MEQKKIVNISFKMVILALFASVFSFVNVYAEDDCSSDTLSKKYDSITVEVADNKVHFSAKDLDNDYKNVKFVLKNYGWDLENKDGKPVAKSTGSVDNLTLSKSQDLYFDLSTYSFSGDSLIFYFSIENDDKCSNPKMEYVVQGVNRKAGRKTPTHPYTPSSETSVGEIDCNADDFSRAFCKARDEAKASGGETSDVTKTFKCDVTHRFTASELKGENYYKNTKYLYKKGAEENVYSYTYKYYLSPNLNPETETHTCKKTCEEAVEVRYGPPVASKAGMCFEYKVKVISRVHCSTDVATPPQKNPDVCTPYPVCTNGSWVGRQGGPNEDFDKCIKSCDNGKYSLSCSKKCYKKIYGNSKKLNNNLLNTYATKLANTSSTEISSVKKCKKNSGDNGCYYRDSYNNIYWDSDLSGNAAEGRWYIGKTFLVDWGLSGFNYSVATSPEREFGIYKADGCGDYCYWTGCSSDEYLNEISSDRDYEANKKVYETAKGMCKAGASCSTKVAEFTIKASYTPGEKSKVVETFPSESNPDNCTPNAETGKLESCTNEKEDTTLLNEFFNTDMDKDFVSEPGCYQKNGKKSDRYIATWSFPGTWINLKTGEISYKKPTTTKAWQKEDDKFCTPLDAKDVNQKYWNYYYNKINSTTNNISYSMSNEMCSNDYITNQNQITESDIEDWNIEAHTKKFGYFDWDITIKCFYALNTNNGGSTASPPDTSVDPCKSGSDNYRIRPIELDNMFPAEEGKSGNRTPGFNWSDAATTTSKNSEYGTLSVSALADKIQSNADNIYSDENKDYEFVLSKSDLTKLRSIVKGNGNNYAKFTGDISNVDDSYGISRYRSRVIRDVLKNTTLPSDEAIKCNNMFNRASCERNGD